MANLLKDVKALRDPANIKKAKLASSPYVLRKIFAADPTIRRLISAREEVVPLIREQIRTAERLDEITLAAFTFIIENVKAEAAPQLFGGLFRKSVAKPGPFFVHFAAHAIRSALRLPIKPLETVYSQGELIETQNKLR
jgi:hypothetical protein